MKILIIKASSLGDIVQAFSVLEPIKSKYPEASIDWVVEEPYAELCRNHPCLAGIHTIHTKKWRKSPALSEIKESIRSLRKTSYDLAIDLQGNLKSSLVLAFVKASRKVGFGKSYVPEKVNLLFTHEKYTPPSGQNIRDDYLYLVQKALDVERAPVKPKPPVFKNILVAPGSAWVNKQLSQATLLRFLELLQKETGCHFHLLWGTNEEKELALALHSKLSSTVIDKLPLSALAELMKGMDLVISMDSLPLHLAGSLNIPTFGVFGPSSAQKYNPSPSPAFQAACPYNEVFMKRCPQLRTCPTGACLKNLEGDRLYETFKEGFTQ